MRGNVVDMTFGIIIGGAFGAIVRKFCFRCHDVAYWIIAGQASCLLPSCLCDAVHGHWIKCPALIYNLEPGLSGKYIQNITRG